MADQNQQYKHKAQNHVIHPQMACCQLRIAIQPCISGMLQAESLPPPLQVIVKVCDVDAQVMEAMLMFMYGCLESVPPKAAMPLFSACDR